MQIPPPNGGSGRQVAIDLDPFKLAAKQLSPQDVVTAVLNSNTILPAGISRMGDREYDVAINRSPIDQNAFNRIPIKVVNGATVYVGDVAHAHDGYGNLFNTVHVNGRRAVYMAILKNSDASTLAIVDATRDVLPALKAAAPEGLGYSDGRNTMILTGLKGDEAVGLNVPPEIVEGSKVQTVEAPKQPPSEL